MRIDREEKAARAEALFREGYNCAQSVVLAYTEEMGLEMKNGGPSVQRIWRRRGRPARHMWSGQRHGHGLRHAVRL